MTDSDRTVVLICARDEWDVALDVHGVSSSEEGPYPWFEKALSVGDHKVTVVFVHSGAGKVPAAAATQYAIDCWHPLWMVNVGTCGGFKCAGVSEGEVILATRTVIYDIKELSGGQSEMEARFTTDLSCGRLSPPFPSDARAGILASADRDVCPVKTEKLHAKCGAVAADWESGAVAHVAETINSTDCLILRTVSDVVGESSKIYGNTTAFEAQVRSVFPHLLRALPEWFAKLSEEHQHSE